MALPEWSLGDLVRKVEEQSPESGPLDRLETATRWSEDLNRIGDNLVGHFIEEARRAGHSWSEVGARLGMSKQGAQQRYERSTPKVMGDISKKVVERVERKRKSGAEVFHQFTDRARRVMVLAQDEARALNHNYLGTEHVLLGLIAEGEGIAYQALTKRGVDIESIRSEVIKIIGTGKDAASGPPPFTPRAKKVIELALREALQLGHNYIGTEHLLLGLIREGEGVGPQVLLKADVTHEAIRAEVLRLLDPD
jgi:hypothetical protein